MGPRSLCTVRGRPPDGAAHFANPNSSAEAYILHRMQQNDHLQSYCGAIGRDLSRDPSGEAQNVDFSKILGMASPGVEYVPTSLETIFKLFTGPQRPYIKKSDVF